MPPKQRKSLVVAGVLILAVAGLLLLMLAGDRLGEGLSGPAKIARAPDGTIWVASHGHLHQFDTDGKRLQKVSLAELGIDSLVSGIAIAGYDSVFIAQADPSRLYRCALPRKTCSDLSLTVAKTAGATTHALMLAADPATQRLVVSDNGAHRVLLTDFDGNVLGQSVPYQFRFPNQPSWLAADAVALADTNHHRIVTLGIAGNRVFDERGEFATTAKAFGRPGRIWPMDAQRTADGAWWVLNAQNGMRNADLLRFDARGEVLTRIDLGAASDPTAIATIGEDVLVTEPLRASLTRVVQGASGEFTSQPFGDAAFRGELAKLESDRTFWSRMRLAAQALMIVAPLVGIFVLWRLGEPVETRVVRNGRPEGIEPTAVDGVHWVAVNPRFARRGRRVWLAYLLLCVAVTAGAAIYVNGALQHFQGNKATMATLAFFGIIAASLILFALYMTVRGPAEWRMRVGTDGRALLLDRDRGPERVERYPFPSIVTNGRQLLAGRHLVTLATPLGKRFDPDELARYLLSRLPHAAFVSPAELLRRALQNGNRALWTAMILLLATIGIGLLSSLFPELAAAWHAAFTRGLAALPGIAR